MLERLDLEQYVMPILAGAGILGLGVGLGAGSLVTDVVSGFFILFETQYLVGDYVQIGDAIGVVEAVSIRVTHVRDAPGQALHHPQRADQGGHQLLEGVHQRRGGREGADRHRPGSDLPHA